MTPSSSLWNSHSYQGWTIWNLPFPVQPYDNVFLGSSEWSLYLLTFLWNFCCKIHLVNPYDLTCCFHSFQFLWLCWESCSWSGRFELLQFDALKCNNADAISFTFVDLAFCISRNLKFHSLLRFLLFRDFSHFLLTLSANWVLLLLSFPSYHIHAQLEVTLLPIFMWTLPICYLFYHHDPYFHCFLLIPYFSQFSSSYDF